MSARKLLRMVCIGLVATMSFSLTPAMSQPTPEQQELINASLDDFALILSDALSQEANQGYVWDTISTSRNEEMIVDLEALASDAPRPGGQGGIWDELEGAIVALHDDLAGEDNDNIGIAQEPNDTPIPAIDLYFPVEEHRKKWDGTAKDLLVAYAPVGNEEDVESIIAYSAETGEAVVLDPNNPPQDHLVLVVGLDEGAALDPSPPLMEMAPPVDEAVDPCEVDVNDTNSYIGIPWIYLKDDQEPWWKGRAEIYVLVGQVTGSRTPIEHMIHLKKVNYEGRWYYLGNSLLYFYFSSSYAPETYFHFWEEDWGGSPLSVNASIMGVGLGFKVYDNDDNMGKRYIHRNAVPWVGTKRFSTGYVLVEVDKDP